MKQAFLALGCLVLVACVPSTSPAGLPISQRTQAQPTEGQSPSAKSGPSAALRSDLRADFGPAGVTWVAAGQACVARVPDLNPRCPTLPPVLDVAWNEGQAWAAVSRPNLLVTLDGPPRSFFAGKVVLLSQTRAYREDGSAWSYQNAPARGVAGRPSQVKTGGDGLDYALVAGQLWRVDTESWLGYPSAPWLVATSEGVSSELWPSAVSVYGLYRLRQGKLERLLAGEVKKSVQVVGAELLGVVGNSLVVLSRSEQDLGAVQLRRYTWDLEPL